MVNLLPMNLLIPKHKQTTVRTLFSDTQLMRSLFFETKSELTTYLKNRKLCISFVNEHENVRVFSLFCLHYNFPAYMHKIKHYLKLSNTRMIFCNIQNTVNAQNFKFWYRRARLIKKLSTALELEKIIKFTFALL